MPVVYDILLRLYDFHLLHYVLSLFFVALLPDFLEHDQALTFHLLNALFDQNDSLERYLLQRPGLLFGQVIELFLQRLDRFQTFFDVVELLVSSHLLEHSQLLVHLLGCSLQKRRHLVNYDLPFGLEMVDCLETALSDEAPLCSYAVLNEPLDFLFLDLFIGFIVLSCIRVGFVEVESIIDEESVDLLFNFFGTDGVCDWIQLATLVPILLLCSFQGDDQVLLVCGQFRDPLFFLVVLYAHDFALVLFPSLRIWLPVFVCDSANYRVVRKLVDIELSCFLHEQLLVSVDSLDGIFDVLLL